MRAKHWRLLILSVCLGITLSYQACGQAEDNSDGTSVSIKIPHRKTSSDGLTASSQLQSLWNSQISVESASDLNCFGIMVGGPEDYLQAKNCSTDDGGSVKFGVTALGLLHGGEAKLRVNSGPDRRFFFVGWRTTNPTSCENLRDGSVTPDQVSAPYVLAEVTQDLTPGENKLKFKGRFSESREIVNCNVFELIQSEQIDLFSINEEDAFAPEEVPLETTPENIGKVVATVSGLDSGESVTVFDFNEQAFSLTEGSQVIADTFDQGMPFEIFVNESPYGSLCTLTQPVTSYDSSVVNELRIKCQRIIAKGELDSQFADSGVKIVDLGDTENSVDLGLDAQGKPVLWFSHSVSYYEFTEYSCRFTDAGIFDPGLNGGQCLSTASEGEQGHSSGDPHGLVDASGGDSMIFFDDGSYLMVSSNYNWANGTSNTVVSKINSLGMADPTFGENGQVVLAYDTHTWSPKMAVDELGNIVVVGHAADQDYMGHAFVARILPNGQMDNTFGENGKIIFENLANHSSPDFNEQARSLAVRNDGTIWVAGQTSSDETGDAFLLKLR